MQHKRSDAVLAQRAVILRALRAGHAGRYPRAGSEPGVNDGDSEATDGALAVLAAEGAVVLDNGQFRASRCARHLDVLGLISARSVPPANGDLGQAVRRLRRARHLSIEALAFDAGMHPTYLSGIERGMRNPTWDRIASLASALNVPVSTIVYATEQEADTARIAGRDR